LGKLLISQFNAVAFKLYFALLNHKNFVHFPVAIGRAFETILIVFRLYILYVMRHAAPVICAYGSFACKSNDTHTIGNMTAVVTLL